MQYDSGYSPLPRRRGSGSWLTHAIVAVLAAGLAVAVILGFFSPTSSLPGSGAVPSPAPSAAPLASGQQDIVNKVKPGLVIINTTLQYDGEAAAGTGMVVNADGLVLTNFAGPPLRDFGDGRWGELPAPRACYGVKA